MNGQSIDLSQALVTYVPTDPTVSIDGVLTAITFKPGQAKIWAEVTFWNKTVGQFHRVNIQFEEEVLLVDQGEKWLL